MRSTWATLLSVAAMGAAASVGGAYYKLRLLHTNDMHARFEQVSASAGKCSEQDAAEGLCYGGFARVQAALLEEFARAQRDNVSVLSLNAGDTYQGTVWYPVFKWRAVSHFMKMLKIDAMALGNHEFDDGVPGLTPFLNDVGIPVLAANIDFSGEPELADTPIKSHVTFEKGGKKIGVIGYLTPETVTLAQTGKLKFKDEIETIKEEAKRLKTARVDIIIALGHSGYEVDKKIAAQVPDVDVVVGGHSHTFLYSGSPPDSDKPADTYPVMVRQKNGRKVAMVQAYAFTKYLGILDLSFDEKGELVEAKGNPIVLKQEMAEDADIVREVKHWKSQLNTDMSKNLGKTNVLLDGMLCRFFECNLGNLITDAYIHYAAKTHSGPYWTKAAIAIQQAGAIRASINGTSTNGTITKEDVITAIPFFSPLSIVKIQGIHLLEALEWSVARYDTNHMWGRGEFLQVSGLRVTYNTYQPRERRVQSVKVRCHYCKIPRFIKFQENETYHVIMPTFLLQGGDNFDMFKKYGEEVEKFRESETEIVMKYIEEIGLVYNGLENRIIIDNMVSGSINLKSSSRYLFPVLFTLFWLIN